MQVKTAAFNRLKQQCSIFCWFNVQRSIFCKPATEPT